MGVGHHRAFSAAPDPGDGDTCSGPGARGPRQVARAQACGCTSQVAGVVRQRSMGPDRESAGVAGYRGRRRRADRVAGSVRCADVLLLTACIAGVGGVYRQTGSVAATAIAACVAVVLGVVLILRRG